MSYTQPHCLNYIRKSNCEAEMGLEVWKWKCPPFLNVWCLLSWVCLSVTHVLGMVRRLLGPSTSDRGLWVKVVMNQVSAGWVCLASVTVHHKGQTAMILWRTKTPYITMDGHSVFSLVITITSDQHMCVYLQGTFYLMPSLLNIILTQPYL